MKRISLVGLVSVLLLGACATASPEKSYSVTPQVQVTVRTAKKKAAQANYQAAPPPDQGPLSGSGGTSR